MHKYHNSNDLFYTQIKQRNLIREQLVQVIKKSQCNITITRCTTEGPKRFTVQHQPVNCRTTGKVCTGPANSGIKLNLIICMY